MASKGSSLGVGSAGEVGLMGGEEIQRWTAGRKAAVVLDIIKGKATAADAAKQFCLKYGYTKWRDDPHHLSISMKTIRTLGLA